MRQMWGRLSLQQNGRLALAVAVALALAGCGDNQKSFPTSPQTPTPSFQIIPGSGTWTTAAPMPTARTMSAAGVINGLLYVVGGSDAAGSSTSKRANEAYDPATNTWATKAPDPIANGAGSGVAFAGAGVIAGKLYVVGGCVFADCIPGNTNVLEIYDPVANAWTTGASMPTARNMVAAGVIAGKLYVVGGEGQCGPCIPNSVLEVYDPSTNTWASKAAMPTARAALTAGVLNGILYAIGGRTAGGSVGTVEAYDPTTDTWTTIAALSTRRAFAAAGVVNGILYAVGGDNNGAVLATVEAYDPGTNTWTTTASLPTARYGLAAGVVSGSLYAVGGQDASTILATNEALTPASAPSCVPPPSGMTGWWPGNGNTDDIIGGRNAFLQDNATFGPAQVGDGFVLDGAGDFVDVPDNPALNVGTGDFTVDLWANFSDLGGEQVLIEKYVQATLPGTEVTGWTLSKLPDNSLILSIGHQGGGVTSFARSSGGVVTAGTWYHVAVRRRGATFDILLDGSVIASGSASNDLTSTSSLKFGHRGNPSDTPGSIDTREFFFNGRIDEVELFVGRALSDAEIQAIFNAGSAGKCATTTTPATITLDAPSLSQTHDGTPKVVTFSTTPVGVSGVALTYDGSATAPTNAGSYAILAHLDNPDFSAPDVTGTLVIHPAGQTIAFGALAARTFGAAPFAVNATATSGLSVSFAVGAGDNCSISGNTVTLTGAGSCSVTASQAGNGNYDAADAVTQTFAIARATPLLTWSPPASIVFGTALSGAQLNATATGVGGASLSGTFTYSPAAGTILSPGPHPLGVSFAPDDQTNYSGAAKTVSITVLYSTAVGHGFLQPINVPPQVESVFKIGSTIPVKFQLFLADGVTPVSTALATIQVNKVSSGVPSGVNETVTSTVPNQGINFRYDQTSQQYIFNLGTKGWTAGSYQITALLDDGGQITVVIGVR
jgi:N-acetylneuraminic acid mutarotase